MNKLVKLALYSLFPIIVGGVTLHQVNSNRKYHELANLIEEKGEPEVGKFTNRPNYSMNFKIEDNEYSMSYFPKSKIFPPNKKGIIINIYPDGELSKAQHMQDWGLNGLDYSNPKVERENFDSLVSNILMKYKK
jgi:hypothetical protein